MLVWRLIVAVIASFYSRDRNEYRVQVEVFRREGNVA